MMEPSKGNVEQSVKVCSRLVEGLQVVHPTCVEPESQDLANQDTR